MLEETLVTCPSCWETVSLTIDLSAGDAAYPEDCSVCCRPMVVRVTVAETGEWDVAVDAEND